MPNENFVECTSCKHPFGRWRMRCPVCGASNQNRMSLNDAVNQFYAKDKPTEARVKKSPRREKTRAADECIFCRRGKSNAICQGCHEPIHDRCINIHKPACDAFQQSLRETEATVEKRSEPVAPGRSSLENTGGLADAINRSLKGE
jgi:hypothetical protein